MYLYFVARGNRHVAIHRAVCEAWHGPGGDLDARHLDGDSLNNAATNLAWGTRTENMADAKRHGTLVHGERHWGSVLTEDLVRTIRRMRATGLSYQRISDTLGLNYITTYNAATGRTWSHVRD